jgi:hypothetical protein
LRVSSRAAAWSRGSRFATRRRARTHRSSRAAHTARAGAERAEHLVVPRRGPADTLMGAGWNWAAVRAVRDAPADRDYQALGVTAGCRQPPHAERTGFAALKPAPSGRFSEDRCPAPRERHGDNAIRSTDARDIPAAVRCSTKVLKKGTLYEGCRMADVGLARVSTSASGILPSRLHLSAADSYCFSYTETTSTGCPLASVPFVVVVRVFPSAETTMVEVAVTFPPCLLVIRVVFASTRVRATTSP